MTRDDQRVAAMVDLANEYLDAHENGDRSRVNEIWDQIPDVPAFVALMAGWVLRTESKLENAERQLHVTRDVRPAGLSRAEVWRIAEESAERKIA